MLPSLLSVGSLNLPGIYGLADMFPEIIAGVMPVAVAGMAPAVVIGAVPVVGRALLMGKFLPKGVEPCGCAVMLDPEGFDMFLDLVDWVMM